jgi:hypothetical protein
VPGVVASWLGISNEYHAIGHDIEGPDLALCDTRAWSPCLERLDAARELDKKGDEPPQVLAARAAVEDGFAEHPSSSRRLAPGRDL